MATLLTGPAIIQCGNAGPGFCAAGSIWVTAGGDVWVSDVNKIWKYTAGSGGAGNLGTPVEWQSSSVYGASGNPNCVAVAANGDVFVGMAAPGSSVKRYTSTGTLVGALGTFTTWQNQQGAYGPSWETPYGFAISSTGDLYVADNAVTTASNGVFRIAGGSPQSPKEEVGYPGWPNPPGYPLWAYYGQSNFAKGAAISANGDVFATIGSGGTLSFVTRNATSPASFEAIIDTFNINVFNSIAIKPGC
jgi:hypothetical protein